ncbi:OmpH family outer membrane protein [Candidatus Desantisbacteria bacterium]|nr:OmpH family outer membrane protein [Candidatus Desantisbacteria bacterium]
MLRRCLLLMTSMLLLVSFTGYVSAETNIGLVDTKAVFENHPKAQQAKESMEQDIAKFQDTFQTKQEEVKALKEKLDSATLLSDEEKEKQKKQINDKIAELMKYKEDMSTQIETKEQELTKEIVDDIYAAISSIAKEKNLQLVIEKGSTLYAASGLDLTKDVMGMLEKKNQKTESKSLDKN